MRYFALPIASMLWLQMALGQQAPRIRAFGGPPDNDRASTRVLYFDSQSQRFVGQLQIGYGRPIWDPSYDDQKVFAELTKGKTLRLGKNFWTSLDTTVVLNFSGKMVQPGLHYLGLNRSAQGEWGLAFFNPVEVRNQHMDASRTSTLTPDFTIPLEGTTSELPRERLTIAFSYAQATPTRVTLKIEWGPYLLSAPIEVLLPR